MDRLDLSSSIISINIYLIDIYIHIYICLLWPLLTGKRPLASQIDCQPFNRCKSTAISGDLSLHCASLMCVDMEDIILIPSSTTAYQRASSSAAFAEAQSQAKRFENEAYDQAASRVCDQSL